MITFQVFRRIGRDLHCQMIDTWAVRVHPDYVSIRSSISSFFFLFTPNIEHFQKPGFVSVGAHFFVAQKGWLGCGLEFHPCSL